MGGWRARYVHSTTHALLVAVAIAVDAGVSVFAGKPDADEVKM